MAKSPQNTILAKVFWIFHYFKIIPFFFAKTIFSASKQYGPFAQGVHHRG
jgi:hypothetical protein